MSLSGHAHHQPVREWFDALQGRGSAAFCRATQQSFLRLLTSRGLMSCGGVQELTNRQAWAHYESLLADYRVTFLDGDPPGLQARWKALAERNTASPKLWMDAYLASFAITGGHRLVTTDRGFKQFAGLDLLLLPQPN